MNFYVINNGLISADGMSGSDQRALHWSEAFVSKGHSVTMVIPEEGKERYKEFHCLVTDKSQNHSKFLIMFVYLKRALKASYLLFAKLKLERRDNTLIYSSSDLLPDSIPAILNKITKRSRRWISGLHLIAPNPFKGFKKASVKGYAFPDMANIYYFLTQRIILSFMKKYAYLIMVSNSLDKEFLIGRGFSGRQVIVTYGAVDWGQINSAVKQSHGYSACYVGRFHKQKGFPDVIAAWKKVCNVIPEAVLAVIGADINLKEMISKVRSEGLSNNIKFMGFLSGADKYSIMKSCKICVFPSTYESFGMVAAEAMACGLPVVAYDLPIYREIYPEGMLRAPIGDANGLASRILDLLSDGLLREKMGRAAYEISKNFSWEKTANQILESLN